MEATATQAPTNYFRKCPVCHNQMQNLWLCDYDFVVSCDFFKGWRCKKCKSEFPAKVGDSLESFVPKRNEKKYQAMIAGIPKLTEIKPEEEEIK